MIQAGTGKSSELVFSRIGQELDLAGGIATPMPSPKSSSY